MQPRAIEEIKGQTLTDIVRFNSWGTEYGDLAAAPLRGQMSQSYIGTLGQASCLHCVPCMPPWCCLCLGLVLCLKAP